MTFDDLNQLRSAIVRAVGRSWHDGEYKRSLIADGGMALEAVGYRMPNRMNIKLVLEESAEDDHNFDPIHVGGWYGTDNKVRLCLPPCPRDPAQKAEALAAYNQEHPIGF